MRQLLLKQLFLIVSDNAPKLHLSGLIFSTASQTLFTFHWNMSGLHNKDKLKDTVKLKECKKQRLRAGTRGKGEREVDRITK